jgi:hypothetical protein
VRRATSSKGPEPEKGAAPPAQRIWLVEQDVSRLPGEYLTEAMVLAPTAAEALAAAASLADPVSGFGLVVRRGRLRAFDFGPAPQPPPAVLPRHRHGRASVLAVGLGRDA